MAHMGISARVWSIIAPHGPHMRAWDRRVERWCSTQGSGFEVGSSDAPHEACKGCAADCVERYCSAQRATEGEKRKCGAISFHTIRGHRLGIVVWSAVAPHTFHACMCGALSLHTLHTRGYPEYVVRCCSAHDGEVLSSPTVSATPWFGAETMLGGLSASLSLQQHLHRSKPGRETPLRSPSTSLSFQAWDGNNPAAGRRDCLILRPGICLPAPIVGHRVARSRTSALPNPVVGH